jgi:hypothetical protein
MNWKQTIFELPLIIAACVVIVAFWAAVLSGATLLAAGIFSYITGW